MVYTGGCHCGAISFEYLTDIDPADWSVRACQCSFCRAHDALSTSHPAAEICFAARDPSGCNATDSASVPPIFYSAGNAAFYIGAVIETAAGRFGIINTHALKPVPENIASVAPISYDGEDTGGRVARREERWAPVRTAG